jgi:UDP-N-acetylmuramoyl-tripeptide--D-alanyl-D-alanine ligase
LQVPGVHNQKNALAAAAATLACGISSASIRRGLEGFSGMPGRLQTCFSALGAVILDDTYNANPDSVMAALDVLAKRTGRRILVLGDLGELGESGPALHAEVGEMARRMGIDDCCTVGTLAEATGRAFGPHARHYANTAALIAWLRPQLNADSVVLVKGSRFMHMEDIVSVWVQ